MTTKTPIQRLETLLKLHGGHCFIIRGCDDYMDLKRAAIGMETAGLVTVTNNNGGIVKGLDIKRKGYRPKRATPDEMEAPTH